MTCAAISSDIMTSQRDRNAHIITIIRPHRIHNMHSMRPIATDIARSVVCLSVCWSH